MNPRGKHALVTGGGVRLGRAISLGLAEAGAHVAVHYHRSVESARDTVAQARTQSVEALAVQADLSEPENACGLLSTVQERMGAVDILVHAASPFVATPLAQLTLPAWRAIQGVVAESFWLLVQGLAPGMAESGQGAVVAILDRGAFEPWPDYLAHGTAKSALWALVRSLAVGLAPAVRVNAVVSGPVLPPRGLPEAQKARHARATLLGRWGSPQDVVEAVLYLVGAPYVTGEALFVDGGERWGHRLPRD